MLAALAVLAIAAAWACSGPPPTSDPTPSPTPTPPYGLPPLTLPADEAPHNFQTEWWYFNIHLAGDSGKRFALHDVVFQIQEPDSRRSIYVRQVGLADATPGGYATAERVHSASEPLPASPSGFDIRIGDWVMSGKSGSSYRLVGGAGGTTYDLTLTSTGDALLHDDDGLVDFEPAGVTYYYSRPRLDAKGTVTAQDGSTVEVEGLGWLDKQWGNFQPVLVTWDWASVQLEDGTDLMLSRLLDANGNAVDTYATLRLPAGHAQRLDDTEFTFEPLEDTWRSPRTGTTYRTHWRVGVPAHNIDFILRPLATDSEFASTVLGVVYWEAGAEAVDSAGAVIGQGFVELNWRRGSSQD